MTKAVKESDVARDAQHTPGRWYVDTGRDAGGKYSTPCIKADHFDGTPYGKASDTFIAQCRVTDYWNDAEGTALANARLMAAAPDLLEALELAYLCLQDAYTKTGIDNDPKFVKMRAAIARARGMK